MNTTYLSDDKIKELKNYLDNALPPKTRAILIKMKTKMGIEVYGDKKTNLYKFQGFVISKMKEKGIYNENSYGLSEHIQKFINDNYAEEYQFLKNYDGEPIFTYLNQFCDKNYVEQLGLHWREIVECTSFEKLLNEKYSKKNINPELFKKTNDMIKAIKIFYQDMPDSAKRNNLMFAFNIFLEDKDEQLFFNRINQIQN